MSVEGIQIISTKEEWNALLNSVEQFDFYHTFDYHQLSKQSNEQPILIKYQKDDSIIGLPLLLREIYETEYYDITSVYGYVGSVHKNIGRDFDTSLFQTQLKKYFKEQNIVSVFSRLNPYIDFQENVLLGLGDIITLGDVVNIDITKSVEISRSNYSKSTKSRVNKARKQCYVKKITSDNDINIFVDIYYENMKRLNAKDNYFFDRSYFFDFYKSSDFETEILLVYDDKTDLPIAGSMFVKTNQIIQFHLSGTRDAYLNIAPARVFLDEMRLIGTEEGFKYFNLGGGLGAEKDSLFEFKSSFSKDFKSFKIWRYIVDEEVYEELSNQFSNSEKSQAYFPLYRNNL